MTNTYNIRIDLGGMPWQEYQVDAMSAIDAAIAAGMLEDDPGEKYKVVYRVSNVNDKNDRCIYRQGGMKLRY